MPDTSRTPDGPPRGPSWTGSGRAAPRSSGTRYAIMGGAMSWVSERQLVSAISNAGGFGVIACGSMGPALLAAEIAGTQALTGAAVRRQPDHHASRSWTT